MGVRLPDGVGEVREVFEKAGLSVKCEDLGDCEACYYKEGKDLLVIFVVGGEKPFAKIVPFHKLPPTFTCETAFLVPHGAYAFAEDLESLAMKVKEKVKLVKALSD